MKGKVTIDANSARFKIIIGDKFCRLNRPVDTDDFVTAMQMIATEAYQQGKTEGENNAFDMQLDDEKELAFYESVVNSFVLSTRLLQTIREAHHLAESAVINRREFIKARQQKAPD